MRLPFRKTHPVCDQSLDKMTLLGDIIPVKALVFAPAAAKQFDALPPRSPAIEGRGDVKRQIGREGYRMRVGGYRLIFDETWTTILALRVGRRNTNIYS